MGVMPDIWFRGAQGNRLAASRWGDEEAPAVLLVPGVGEDPDSWSDVAEALAASGRHVIAIEPRGRGDRESTPGGGGGLSADAADLVAVLRQLRSRAAVVGAGPGALAALVAGGESEDLISALALIAPEPAEPGQLLPALAKLKMPTLLVQARLDDTPPCEARLQLHEAIPCAEFADIDEARSDLVASDAFMAMLVDFLDRRLPRLARSFTGGSDPRLLRDALGCFGTGVTVVTTMDPEGAPIGFTANSFTSVSLDPPLVLFCVAKKSLNFEIYRNARRFAINVMHVGQQPTSDRFARPGGSRFEGIGWEIRTPGGAPVLNGSRASFDCTTHAVHDGGDHVIVIGRVQRADYEAHRDPLLFLQGKYRRVHFD